MVREGEDQRERILWCIQVLHHDATIEDLRQAVGSDEAEAAYLAFACQRGRAVPPVHDEVGALRHIVIDHPQCLDVAIA